MLLREQIASDARRHLRKTPPKSALVRAPRLGHPRNSAAGPLRIDGHDNIASTLRRNDAALASPLNHHSPVETPFCRGLGRIAGKRC